MSLIMLAAAGTDSLPKGYQYGLGGFIVALMLLFIKGLKSNDAGVWKMLRESQASETKTQQELQAIKLEHRAEMVALKLEHKAEIEALKVSHKADMEALREEVHLALGIAKKDNRGL